MVYFGLDSLNMILKALPWDHLVKKVNGDFQKHLTHLRVDNALKVNGTCTYKWFRCFKNSIYHPCSGDHLRMCLKLSTSIIAFHK